MPLPPAKIEKQEVERIRSDQSDKDSRPLNVFEEYRRAKKNSLLWSSLTIFVSFGVSWPRVREDTEFTNAIELSWVAKGIAFPPWLLVGAFFLSSFYMWLSWRWADSRLMLVNSPELFQESVTDLVSAINEVRSNVDLSRKALSDAYRAHIESSVSYERLKSRSDLYLNPELGFAEKLVSFDATLTDASNGILSSTSKSQVGSAITSVKRDVGPLLSDVRSIANNKKRIMEGEVRKKDQEISEELNHQLRSLNSQIETFNTNMGQLTGFSDRIGLSERVRVLMLDYIPINVAFIFALISSMGAGAILFNA